MILRRGREIIEFTDFDIGSIINQDTIRAQKKKLKEKRGDT